MGVTATGARAGVWTPDAGSAYQRLAFNFFRNDASFSAGRDRREGFKEFTNTNLTYYMEDGLGLGKIAATIHPYPTQAGVVKRAGDAYNRTRLTPTVRRLFERCECPRNEGAGAGIQRSWGGGSHGPARRRREGCASSLQ